MQDYLSEYAVNVLFVSYPRNAAIDIYSFATWLGTKTNYAQTTRIQMQNREKTVLNFLTGSIVIEYDLFNVWKDRTTLKLHRAGNEMGLLHL